MAVGYGLGQRAPLQAGSAAVPQAVQSAPAPVVPQSPASVAAPVVAPVLPADAAPVAPAGAASVVAALGSPTVPAVIERPDPAAIPKPLQDTLEQRYADVAARAARGRVANPRGVRRPAQDFWSLQVGLSDSAAGALRLAGAGATGRAEVWVGTVPTRPQGQNQDGGPVGRVRGRYASRAQAVQNLQNGPTP